MKIPVILNGENTVLEVPSDKMLSSVLRERGLISVKCGCSVQSSHICGACTVMLDGRPVPSCIVPVAIARDSRIVTLEYFSKTENYTDIVKGFKIAGVKLCSFCDAGKIFAAEYFLQTTRSLPSTKTIYDTISHLIPCCSNIKQLTDGIILSFNTRADRLAFLPARSDRRGTRR